MSNTSTWKHPDANLNTFWISNQCNTCILIFLISSRVICVDSAHPYDYEIWRMNSYNADAGSKVGHDTGVYLIFITGGKNLESSQQYWPSDSICAHVHTCNIYCNRWWLQSFRLTLVHIQLRIKDKPSKYMSLLTFEVIFFYKQWHNSDNNINPSFMIAWMTYNTTSTTGDILCQNRKLKYMLMWSLKMNNL